MKLNKAGIIAREPGAISELYNVVRHCARIGVARANAHSLMDDVHQEVAMLVIERLIHVYDERRDVEPYLIDTCRRIALGMRRAHTREVLFSQGGDDDDNDWQNAIADPDSKDLAEVMVEQEAEARAAAAVVALSKALTAAEPSPPAPSAPKLEAAPQAGAAPAPAKGGKKAGEKLPSWYKPRRGGAAGGASRPAREVSERGLELREIRTKLRYTHGQMADALAVEPHVVRNLEYGMKVEIPDELLERARALLAKHEGDFGVLTMSAPDLVRSWCGRLGLEEEDYSGLARYIGTDRSTTFRWLRNEGAPKPARIRHVEAMVQLEEERRRRMAEAARGA